MKTILIGFCLMCASMAQAQTQVPFGSDISNRLFHYHRHTPHIATSGNFSEGAIEELVAHEFKTVIDLRTAIEGVEKDQSAGVAAGINYINMPVGRDVPGDDFVERFGALVDNPENYPLLVRCASANRVGMVWALNQMRQGVSYEQALLEARTIGIRPAMEKKLHSMKSLETE